MVEWYLVLSIFFEIGMIWQISGKKSPNWLAFSMICDFFFMQLVDISLSFYGQYTREKAISNEICMLFHRSEGQLVAFLIQGVKFGKIFSNSFFKLSII